MGELPLLDDGIIPGFNLVLMVSTGQPLPTDKYRSILVGMTSLASFIGAPLPDGQRYVLTGLQQCDSAHRQLERVRQRIATLRDEGFIGASGLKVPDQEIEYRNHIAAATDAWAVIGDLQMAMTVVRKAVGMAIGAPGRFGSATALPRVPKVPALTREAEAGVIALRDACEHIDDRVFDRANKKNEMPLSIFDTASIFTRGTFTYSSKSFDINQGATDLLIATRDYFLALWWVLTARATAVRAS